MATVQVTHRVSTNYIRTRVARPGGPLENHLALMAIAVQSAAKERIRQSPARIDTGNLLNSIQISIYYRNGMPIARIGTDVEYAMYVHDGTIYMEANPFLRDGLIRGVQQFS